MFDVEQDDSSKKWATVTFRCTEEEKAALEILASELITTSSRLARFAVRSLILRRREQMKERLQGCIYGRNV